MKATLQVRMSQHLALTPQLQQSIRLLQLSTLELNQEVEQMLEQNPFLEPDAEAPTTWEESAAPRSDAAVTGDGDDGVLAAAGAEAASSVQGDFVSSPSTSSTGDTGSGPDGSAPGDAAADAGPAELTASDFGTTENAEWSNGTEADDFDGVRELPSLSGAGSGSGEGDDDSPIERGPAQQSLADFLHEQVVGLRLPAGDAAAVHALIESLDDDGYLADPLQEIGQALGRDLDDDALDDLQSLLRCALHWLQRLDPPGVGARSLDECLLLQLRRQPACAVRDLAIQLCDPVLLELMGRRDLRKLCVATGAHEDAVREAVARIAACEPKPGRPFADAQSLIVVPDVVVQRAGRQLKVSLNPDVMPRLRLNSLYSDVVRAQRGSPLAGQLQEARWFMKNIQQRFDTILRVSRAIVERQRAFFTHGAVAMKPLVLREIADELGLHESTISRVTTAKYMATPLGTYELKYFFGSSLNTETGGNASSIAVRALIKQMIAAEPAGKPLSDSAISQLLEEQGIQVARRTVAKYREAMKIAPANLRKSL